MHINIDTLLTIIFVVVIIAFQIFGAVVGRLIKKGRAAPGQTAQPAKPGGVISALASRVNREIQIARQQAAAARKGQAGQSGKIGVLPPAGQAERIIPVGQVDRPPDGQDRKRQAKIAAIPIAPKPPAQTRPAVAAKPAVPVLAAAPPTEQALIEEIRKGLLDETAVKSTAMEPALSETGYAIDDLRRAVVWSEILAPPLALRE